MLVRPELKGTTGSNMCGIGTFCHEFGHVLGLPDFYNTNNDFSYNTLSTWDYYGHRTL